MSAQELVEYIQSNCIVSENGCWLWSGSLTERGYGRIKAFGKNWPTHRAFFVCYYNIELPPDLFVCHHCDVRNCCNPEHLFVGTALDNMLDMVAKGRQSRGPRQTSPPKSKKVRKLTLTPSLVREIRDLLTTGRFSQRAISRMYGVHHSLIGGIKIHKYWRSV